MATDQVRITLRIPRDVHTAAVALAKKTERSLNWQMVHLMKIGLEASGAELCESAASTKTAGNKRVK